MTGLDSRISESVSWAYPDIEVVATAGKMGNHVLSGILTHPDLILMDIWCQAWSGVCDKKVKRALSDIKIIILATFDDDGFILVHSKYGASGYLFKGASDEEELYEAIKVVYQGG